MKTIILTGFKPFGSYACNPVEDSTNRFNGKTVSEYTVVGAVLECTYRGAFDALQKIIEATDPIGIVSTGFASRVRGIQFETTGRNIMNGKYPDADGFEPKKVPIIPHAPEFIDSTANNHALANMVHAGGVPTKMSADAEGFICNSLLYLTSKHVRSMLLRTPNAFIHTPWPKEYRDKVESDPEKIFLPAGALDHAIETIIKNIEHV